MINTILSALLPMVVTFLLGFVAAWRHDFGSKDATMLNRMVLLTPCRWRFLPEPLRHRARHLIQDIPLVIALCIAIIGLYGVVFLLVPYRFPFAR